MGYFQGRPPPPPPPPPPHHTDTFQATNKTVILQTNGEKKEKKGGFKSRLEKTEHETTVDFFLQIFFFKVVELTLVVLLAHLAVVV